MGGDLRAVVETILAQLSVVTDERERQLLSEALAILDRDAYLGWSRREVQLVTAAAARRAETHAGS